MPSESLLFRQPLPDYTLIERIGSGGYGEVWRAAAPGGLAKAVKFVFGSFDESRANRERKSIDRIKDVRHPFLLSIERIEVVDRQFIIVTELADCSLKDRFVECKSLGQPGIPREELLTYMRDAADALDFMLERHSLQHLDIKPENLLLLGNRVKVADFGLVKDLHEASVSILDGMTPLYSPPELFDGRPTNRSDQYSLAVVYMEMLTGRLPFSASTAAQLAAMHILPGYKPNVAGMPENDREPLLRALSRDPKARFSSCRDFVQQLCGVAPHSAATAPAPPTSDQWPRGTMSPTEVFAEGCAPLAESLGTETDCFEPAGSDQASVSTTGVETWASRSRAAGDVRPLPPVEWNPAAWKPRPTLVVGIGGTAGRVIRSLRQRLTLAHGSLDEAPAFATLLLDSDSDSLHAATTSSLVGASSSLETLCLRLRTTNEYREQSSSLLQWISRRWLYNIPRRPQTQGLRPLGRLALVDHSKTWFKRLQEALERVRSPEAVAQTQRALGRDLESSPRIVVVTSISGGIGGGSVIDIAYSIRQIMRTLGVSQYSLSGLLTHSTGGGTESQELSVASARAALHEIYHYSTASMGYPGDRSMGLAPAAPRTPLFDDTYYLNLGSQVSELGLDRAADSIGEYLFHDVATDMGQLLTAIRREASAAPSDDDDDVPLRTCQTVRLGGLSADAIELIVRKIAEHAATGWLTPAPRTASRDETAAESEAMARRRNSAHRPVVSEFEAFAAAAFGADANATFRHRIVHWLAAQCLSWAESDLPGAAEKNRPQLAKVDQSLGRLAARFREMSGSRQIWDRELSLPETTPILSTIHARLPEIADQAAEFFWQMAESATLHGCDADQVCRRVDCLPDVLLAASFRAAISAIGEDQVLSDYLLKLGDASEAVQTIRKHFQMALPAALATGGARRMILVAPRSPETSTLTELVRRILGEELLVVEGQVNDLLLVCEGECISLRRSADQLVDGRQVYVDAANRLLTRVDVNWQPMPLLK